LSTNPDVGTQKATGHSRGGGTGGEFSWERIPLVHLRKTLKRCDGPRDVWDKKGFEACKGGLRLSRDE